MHSLIYTNNIIYYIGNNNNHKANNKLYNCIIVNYITKQI